MGALRWIVLGRERGLRARVRGRLRRLLARLWERRREAPRGAAPTRGPAPPAAPLPAGLVRVARLGELPPGALREVLVEGRSVVLARVGDAVHAFAGTCPHAGGALADGQLDGTTLTCPMHGWTFDVATGECHVNPQERIPILRVEVVGDAVLVEI